MNTRFLSGLCAILPGALMLAAHWFPWRKLLGRDLYRLEAYSVGTGAIVATAAAATLVSDGDKRDHAGFIVTAAASAGIATLLAWALDHYLNIYYASYEKQVEREVSDGLRPQ